MKPGCGMARVLIAGVVGLARMTAAGAGEPTFTRHVVAAMPPG